MRFFEPMLSEEACLYLIKVNERKMSECGTVEEQVFLEHIVKALKRELADEE